MEYITWPIFIAKTRLDFTDIYKIIFLNLFNSLILIEQFGNFQIDKNNDKHCGL